MAAVAAAACSSGDASGPTETSAPPRQRDAQPTVETAEVHATASPDIPAFCNTLANATAELRTRTSPPTGSTADQFFLLVANVPAASELIRELTSLAPAEIAADIVLAADRWSDEVDAVGGEVPDPLGAVAGVLVSKMLATEAATNVDWWSELNCGQPVFGAAGTIAGSQPCEWLPASSWNAVFPAVFEPSEQYSALSQAVRLIADNVPGASRAAQSLLAATDALDPRPRFALEALGRLAWTDVNAAGLITEIDDEVRGLCQIGAFSEDDVARLTSLGPVLAGERRAERISTLFGRCSWPRPAAEFSLLYLCQDEPAVIDLSSGVVRYIDVTSYLPDDDRFLRTTPKGMFWMGWEEEPAQGLNPPRYVTVLHSLDYATFEQREVEVYATSERYDDTQVDLAGISTDRVVVRTGNSFDIYDLELNQVASLPLEDPTWGTESWLTDSTFLMPQRDFTLLVNVAAGTAEPVPGTDGYYKGSVRSASVCRDRGAVQISGLNPETLLTLFEDRSGVQWGSSLDLELTDHDQLGLVARDRFVSTRYGAEALAVDASGGEAWAIPDNVVSNAFVFGGWIVVQNFSGEIFVLDPVTGAETDINDRGFMDAVAATIEGDLTEEQLFSRLTVDRTTGWASFMTDDAVWQISTDLLCPTDYASVTAASGSAEGSPGSGEGPVVVVSASSGFQRAVVTDFLTESGFNVADPITWFSNTTAVYFDPSVPGAESVAEAVAAAVGAQVVEAPVSAAGAAALAGLDEPPVALQLADSFRWPPEG